VSRGRQLAVAAGLLALAIAGWSLFAGLLLLAPVVIVVYAAIIALLLAVERAQYKPILKTPPAAPWRETGERFIDPASGQLVSVWVDPRDGGRAYVAADQAR
jgi:hypothetical protein